jgi:hypothetical protein
MRRMSSSSYEKITKRTNNNKYKEMMRKINNANEKR